MTPDRGERIPPRFHWFAGTFSLLSAVGAAYGGFGGVVFALFAAMFSWQATVYWCFYRRQIDGKQVWEHTSRDEQPGRNEGHDA